MAFAARRESEWDTYPFDVVAVLAEHFDLDVFDQQVIVRILEAHRADPDPGLDVVVDSPDQAHWRLRASDADPSLVVLDACPAPDPDEAADPRGLAVNAELARLR